VVNNGLCIRIYLSESDRIDDQPALTAIIDLCRQAGLHGVSVLRGIEGLGKHGLHSAAFVSLSHQLPLLIEIIDEQARAEQSLQYLLPHLQGFRVATWPVFLPQPSVWQGIPSSLADD